MCRRAVCKSTLDRNAAATPGAIYRPFHRQGGEAFLTTNPSENLISAVEQ